MRRLALSAAMIAIGISLGATAYAMPGAGSRAGAQLKDGGTFRIDQVAPIDFVDPALAYALSSWMLLHATCAKLMNYPDQPPPAGRRPVPEIAAGYRVTPDGKTYTFTLRRGFRFNNRARLDARSFKRGIERLMDPKMESPAVDAGYVQDIVGADEVLAGRASSPSGVVARGNRLVIRLERPIPDFAARLAMPFFCAVPPGLPADPEGVRAYASAGPYYVAEFRPGQRVVLRRNPYYGGKRPHHVRTFVLDNTLSSQRAVVERIERGQADWGWTEATLLQGDGPALVRKYGRNRARLFVKPAPFLRYFVLNSERPLFRSARLRRAVSYAVNRVALAREHGYQVVRPSDQYLPIGFPGFRDAHIYPLKGDVRQAKALAGRRFKGAKAVLYTVDLPIPRALAQIVRRNLARIGLRIEIEAFPINVLLAKLETPGERFDIAWGFGWGADYGDPYGILNILFRNPGGGKANIARFNSPRYNRLLNRASRLSGAKRYRAYGNLDVTLARKAAPLIAYGTDNVWTFVSKRVGCKILRPELDLAAVCLKR